MARVRSSRRPDRLPAVEDESLLPALKAGDEAVLAELVERWSGLMLHMAMVQVHSRAVAEEVVQEAWLTVVRDLGRFEGRSSLRTWVLGIVVNLARARARAERRYGPLPRSGDPAVDPTRLRPPGGTEWPHHWALGPVAWPSPEEGLLAGETRDVILRALADLPRAQREVLVLRDVAGWRADETCGALGLSEGNQRVLLHRARSRVRGALEDYFRASEPT